MPLNKNRIVVASAGSRKTTSIVESALAIREGNVLITTYTNENVDQITSYLVSMNGHVPKNITVLSWYSFLLQDGVRPYQNHMTAQGRINTITFMAKPNRFVLKAKVDDYYLTKGGDIYSDRVAEFICACDEHSNGLVINRLERLYAAIFIDEVQDFAGYDLNVLEKILRSDISVVAVGDPRQATFATNNSLKNKQYKKSHILDWINKGERAKIFVIEERMDCYRSNQLICDFADSLFPALSKTKSMNFENTGHDGVFCIETHEVLDYFQLHKPVVLRHNKRTDTMGLPALNIGVTKGRTYNRVIIFPTEPMKHYLKAKDLKKAGDLTKLYVAVTRARHSVAFVL